MCDRRTALLRPVPAGRITYRDDGRPVIRDTGVSVSEVSAEIGVDQLSDSDILARHPHLEPADLDAVRSHHTAEFEFDVLLRRVLDNDGTPTHDDVLDAYLFLPRSVLTRYAEETEDTQIRVRSSFEAAFTDAARCVDAGIHWLAAIGSLVLFDQIGTALTRCDRSVLAPTSLERALEGFSDCTTREQAALYALRNALAHDFSLVNQTIGNKPRNVALRHSFRLDVEGDDPLFKFPSQPWDGNVNAIRPTTVNLTRLSELTTRVRNRILECHAEGVLRLALTPEEIRRRYIFTVGATIEDYNAQRSADDAARWGTFR